MAVRCLAHPVLQHFGTSRVAVPSTFEQFGSIRFLPMRCKRRIAGDIGMLPWEGQLDMLTLQAFEVLIIFHGTPLSEAAFTALNFMATK